MHAKIRKKTTSQQDVKIDFANGAASNELKSMDKTATSLVPLSLILIFHIFIEMSVCSAHIRHYPY